jgi:hypothetical protein
MPILRNKSKSNKQIGGKLVGVILGWDIHSYFSLFSLAKGRTKSIILKEQIENWYDEKLISDPEETLCNELIQKIKFEWKGLKRMKPDYNIHTFKKELKTELTKRGIQEEHITLILKQIN